MKTNPTNLCISDQTIVAYWESLQAKVIILAYHANLLWDVFFLLFLTPVVLHHSDPLRVRLWGSFLNLQVGQDIPQVVPTF